MPCQQLRSPSCICCRPFDQHKDHILIGTSLPTGRLLPNIHSGRGHGAGSGDSKGWLEGGVCERVHGHRRGARNREECLHAEVALVQGGHADLLLAPQRTAGQKHQLHAEGMPAHTPTRVIGCFLRACSASGDAAVLQRCITQQAPALSVHLRGNESD